MNRYPCPNCRGVGNVSVAFAFGGICTWCNGRRSLTGEEIDEQRRRRDVLRDFLDKPSPAPRPLIDERGEA